MKNLIHKLFAWLFEVELQQLKDQVKIMKDQEAKIKGIVEEFDVSVDVHETRVSRSGSWAVISLQGKRADFVKFIDLEDRDLQEIGGFLRQYERSANIKIDAAPQTSRFLKMSKSRRIF